MKLARGPHLEWSAGQYGEPIADGWPTFKKNNRHPDFFPDLRVTSFSQWILFL